MSCSSLLFQDKTEITESWQELISSISFISKKGVQNNSVFRRTKKGKKTLTLFKGPLMWVRNIWTRKKVIGSLFKWTLQGRNKREKKKVGKNCLWQRWSTYLIVRVEIARKFFLLLLGIFSFYFSGLVNFPSRFGAKMGSTIFNIL